MSAEIPGGRPENIDKTASTPKIDRPQGASLDVGGANDSLPTVQKNSGILSGPRGLGERVASEIGAIKLSSDAGSPMTSEITSDGPVPSELDLTMKAPPKDLSRRVAAMTKSGDDGEIHARVPDGDVPPAADQPWEAGQAVSGPSGTGEFVGYEDRKQGRYVRLRMGDSETLVPEGRFAELYSRPQPTEPISSELEGAEDTREQLRGKLTELLGRTGHIDVDLLGVGFSDDSVRDEVAGVIAEAEENHYLFRSDTRHPFQTSDADIDRGAVPGGVFKNGFPQGDDKVYTTPSLDIALEYPEPNNLPGDWDGKKYTYAMRPDAILDTQIEVRVESIDDEVDVTGGPEPGMSVDQAVASGSRVIDIASGSIRPEDIAYVMEVDASDISNEIVTGVTRNPGFGQTVEGAEPVAAPEDPVLAARKSELRLRLERDIEEVIEGYDVGQLGLQYGSEQAEARVRGLMNRARAEKQLFHNDTRHPLRAKEADRARGAQSGIFDEGLVAQSDEPGFGVFTTPSPAMAMRYPEAHEVPEDWDGKKYFYFVDNEGVVDNPSSTHRVLGAIGTPQGTTSQHLVEVESGTIAPERIVACLEIDSNGNRLLRTFVNKRHTSPPGQ